MKIINSSAEFKGFYYYKSPPNPEPCPKPKEYPVKYPCIVEQIHHDGGLGGDYVQHKITYFPRGYSRREQAIFFKGFAEGASYLGR
jgi:hypothetical protein